MYLKTRENPNPSNSFDRRIGAKIRERRIVLGLAKSHVAKIIGTTCAQLAEYEQGKVRLPARQLCELADLFNVAISWFFEGVFYATWYKPVLA